MVTGETFTAIDIGSSKIKTIIGTFSENKDLQVLGVGVSPSHGVRKGNILDMDEFKRNLDHALSEAERMTGEQVTNVYLTLSGPVIESVSNVGIISVLGTEVTEDDVNRALDMAQNGVDLSNRSVLKVIPETFTIDNQPGLKNPVGMAAKKLEVRAHIYSVATNSLNNIKRAVGDVGVGILDLYPSVITAGEAVLSRRQKELGVVVVEIGASGTNIAVYEEGVLVFSSVVPIGGEHVTSDIALGFRVSIDLAEKLKLEAADLAFAPEKDSEDSEIDLSKLDKNETISVSKKFLGEIVRARYLEIFHLVNAELKRIGRDGMLPEGVVLTGGAAKMRGLVGLAKEIMRLPASVGIPDESDYVSGTSVGDPVYSAVIGTLMLSRRYQTGKSGMRVNLSIGGFWQSLKNAFGKLLP